MAKVLNKKPKKQPVILITEIILWIGAALVLLNLFFQTEITLMGILFNEFALISTITYLRGLHKIFPLALGLMILMFIVNTFGVFSPLDILIYLSGIVGVILKYKTTSWGSRTLQSENLLMRFDWTEIRFFFLKSQAIRFKILTY